MRLILYLMLILSLPATGSAQQLRVTVTNDLDLERKEVAAIPCSKLKKLLKKYRPEDIHVQQKGDIGCLATQWIDYDADGNPDELLFIATIGAHASNEYTVQNVTEQLAYPLTEGIAYSRFVPERSDDYAWENDKVAFRVYGPKGQQEALAGVAGSTLSSGIDIWFKRVPYPVINKWYGANVTASGYYHTDRGEGYDPYHVGKSRGTGGTGIWDNDTLVASQNFVNYKTIATGPLRTVFELEYAPFSEANVREVKRVSLDLHSNFSKFEVAVSADIKLSNYAIGIALHDNKGLVAANNKNGILRHWETIDGSFVGEGIVADPQTVINSFEHHGSGAGQHNLVLLVKPSRKIIYYAGFAWQKSGQVSSVEDWDKMLERQAAIITHPLKVKIH